MLQFIRNIRSSGKALALAALTVVSCSKEIGSPEIVERAGLTIRLSVPQSVEREMNTPRTYAGTEPGYGRENTVEALYIVFYSRNPVINGSADPWKKVSEAALSGDQLPRFDQTSTQGNPMAEFTVENIPVTPSALEAGTQLKAVIYANYQTPPAPISSESDFWTVSGGTTQLKPLFFTGEGEFGKVSDAWTASINLTRQVAKLRIKAGIHPDAVPSTLTIDPQSISVEVKHMADRASTMDDSSRDPGDSFDPATVAYFDRTGAPLRMEENWTAGRKIDSLYMLPHNAGADESKATVVAVKMTVKDPVAAKSKELTLEYPLGKLLADGSTDYTIRRNTIYTTDLQVQSIEGESVNVGTFKQDWDEVGVDVDVPWGQVKTDRARIPIVPGSVGQVHALSLAVGGAAFPWKVELVGADKSTPLAGEVAQIYVANSAQPGNAFTMTANSQAEIRMTAGTTFAGGYFKISQVNAEGGGGLSRYIPVVVATFKEVPVTPGLEDRRAASMPTAWLSL